jgi:hypothetical protein
MTVLDLIKSSLRLIGAIASSEVPNSEMVNDAKEALNSLLGEWHNKGLVSLTEQQTFNISSGSLSYTIGTDMTWNGNKPLKVLSAFISLNSVDYPLEIIGESEYMDISDKSVSCMPSKLFYLPGNNTGTVFLYGKPDQAYTITLLSQKAFTTYTSTSTSVDLPSGYLSALKYALAIEIAPEYESSPSQWLLSRANETISAIKRTNLKKPKAMQFDGIFSGGGGTYNVESDTFV